MEPTIPEPVFINLDYIFLKLFLFVKKVIAFIFSANFLILLKILGSLLVILLITASLYSLVRLHEIQKESKKKKGSSAIAQAADTPDEHTQPIVHDMRNDTWDIIRTKLLSDSPSDWRLAIIEADIYLDKILDDKGFHGEIMSDKLKQVTPDKLGSIQMAWEAHKVRNRIAHEGAAFNLTMPEARRILSYYEIIFRELEVIS